MLDFIYSKLRAFYKHLQAAFATGRPKPDELTAHTRRERRKLKRLIKPEYQPQYGGPPFLKPLKQN
jgi:hypothetical protein